MIQAQAGLMGITGEHGRGPVKVGVAVVDMITGLYAANAIQAALIQRQSTGRGTWIDTALFDSAVAILANQGMNYLIAGEIPERLGSAHPNIVPYQSFPDAQWRPVHCGRQRHAVPPLLRDRLANWADDARSPATACAWPTGTCWHR
jgi:crotonobetainyl-CoA:carnitine CoA-transferase CaiB-like acyl-CoA transferase